MLFFLLLLGAMTIPSQAQSPVSVHPKDSNNSADEMVAKALVGTLYYDFEVWLPQFKSRIAELTKGQQTIPRRIELMKFHFYLAGLTAELSHVLSFTSKFKVDSIRADFDLHSKLSKDMAEGILDEPNLSREQRAEALFYLGASEGYVGIVEYGAGNYISALMNGLNADNHLEEAVDLEPKHNDAFVGLGIYEYGNTRIGGISNFLMQGGRDLRLQGLQHIEQALQGSILSKPLALKTLIWFYISEEINPDNEEVPDTHPLSSKICRKKALQYMAQYEASYFTGNSRQNFVGNKGLAMMKAIQHVLDRDYVSARKQFQRVVGVVEFLEKKKHYKINPQLMKTVKEGIRFCDLMIASSVKSTQATDSVCPKIEKQIEFIEDGGSMVEYESSKIRGEIQNVFHMRLKETYSNRKC